MNFTLKQIRHFVVTAESHSINKTSKTLNKSQSVITWINTHFMLATEMPHGGFKMSGYGKDLSMYALEDYTVPRHIMFSHD